MIRMFRFTTGILLLLTLLNLQLCLAEEKERKRIDYRGFILPEAKGVPKWSINKNIVQESVRGDFFIITTNLKPQERQLIAVLPWAQLLEQHGAKLTAKGEPFRIKPSNLGKQWGYESIIFDCVGSFTTTVNNINNDIRQDITVFLPYLAMQLPSGNIFEI
jgi:hypothetical protein